MGGGGDIPTTTLFYQSEKIAIQVSLIIQVYKTLKLKYTTTLEKQRQENLKKIYRCKKQEKLGLEKNIYNIYKV